MFRVPVLYVSVPRARSVCHVEADFSWDAMRMTPALPLLCCWCVVIAGRAEPTPEEQHARFMSRLRGGPKFVDRAAGTGLPTQLPNAADTLAWLPSVSAMSAQAPPKPREPAHESIESARAATPTSARAAADAIPEICREDYAHFECGEDVPCKKQCAGCSGPGCWTRCFAHCTRLDHERRFGDACASDCARRQRNCTASCAVEARAISTANASRAHTDPKELARARCEPEAEKGRAAGSFPFDCTVPCLQQCEPCDAPDPAHPSAARGAHAGARAQPLADNFPLGGAATHCLVRCFHQCQQDNQCGLMCDKVRAGCDFMCKRIRSGHVHTLPALFMADDAVDSRAPHPPKLEL